MFFNSSLEEIYWPDTQLLGQFVQFELDDFLYSYKNKDCYVLNKEGTLLSADA